MKFTLDKQEKYAVLTPLEERINTLVAPDLKSELVLLHNNGFANIIIDMAQVSLIDSSGLSAILMAKRICDSVGGLLTLTNLNPHVRKMLEIAQLHTVINILLTLTEAVEDVHMHILQRELQGEEDNTGAEDHPASSRLESDPGR